MFLETMDELIILMIYEFLCQTFQAVLLLVSLIKDFNIINSFKKELQYLTQDLKDIVLTLIFSCLLSDGLGLSRKNI